MAAIDNARKMVDELYQGHERDKLSRQEIYDAAVRAPLTPDVMIYFNQLPDGEYDKRKLTRTINHEITMRNRSDQVGLL